MGVSAWIRHTHREYLFSCGLHEPAVIHERSSRAASACGRLDSPCQDAGQPTGSGGASPYHRGYLGQPRMDTNGRERIGLKSGFYSRLLVSIRG